MTEFVSQSFDPGELQQALDVAVIGAKAVEHTLKAQFGSPEYSTKDGDERSWVTRWDTWAQQVVVDKISNNFLGDDIGFKCEEEGVDTDLDVYWTIDPIDGTSHFVRGNDMCTTMIALVDHDIPVVAVINDFIRSKTYTAVAGQGAEVMTLGRRMDKKPLKVSTRNLTVAHLEVYCDEDTDRGQKLLRGIESTGAYLLRNAAAGYTLSNVARGSSEGFVSFRNPFATDWDIAPGVLLIHEAGGIVRNVGNDSYRLSDRNFIAVNKEMHLELARIIEQLESAN